MPGHLAVVGTDRLTRDGDVANNYQEPIVFFLADRKGWSLAADQYALALLASYRQHGARFFANPDPDLLPAGSTLARRRLRFRRPDSCVAVASATHSPGPAPAIGARRP